MKISEGNGDSEEEIPAEVITLVFFDYTYQLAVLGLDKNVNVMIKPESLFI